MSKVIAVVKLPPLRIGSLIRCADEQCKHVIAVLKSVPTDGSPITLANFTLYGPAAEAVGPIHCQKCKGTVVDVFIPDAVGPETVVNPQAHVH